MATGNPYMQKSMPKLQFEWDDAKAATNLRKHGISFQSATQLLLDQDAIELDASKPTDGERRRKVIGMIGGRLFAVVYTLRGDIRRLISARRANLKEERSWLDSH